MAHFTIEECNAQGTSSIVSCSSASRSSTASSSTLRDSYGLHVLVVFKGQRRTCTSCEMVVPRFFVTQVLSAGRHDTSTQKGSWGVFR